MNIVEIVIILLLLLSVYKGFRQGFLRVIFSLFSWIVIFAFILYASPFITTVLKEKTPLYSYFQERASEQLQEDAKNKLISGTEQDLKVFGIELPDSLLEFYETTIQETGIEWLEESGIYQQMGTTVADGAVALISFFLALVIGLLIWSILTNALDLMSRLPVIHTVNHFLGALAGFLKGMLLQWILFYLLYQFRGYEWASLIENKILESPILNYLYQNNLVEQLITFLL